MNQYNISKHEALAKCCLNVGPTSTALGQHLNSGGPPYPVWYDGHFVNRQQTLHVDPMLALYWSTVADAGPTLTQHWVNVSCLPVFVEGHPHPLVSTAAFHARARGSFPGIGGLKETKMYLPNPLLKLSIVGSLRAREVACSASNRQVSNFESCVCRTVSSHSSYHPQEVLLAQFSLYVLKGGLKPDSFHLPFTLKFEVRFPVSAVWKKQKCFSPSTRKTQYCGEAPCPRGSVLGLRPPGLEFRILCLEGNVISLITPSSGGSPDPV